MLELDESGPGGGPSPPCGAAPRGGAGSGARPVASARRTRPHSSATRCSRARSAGPSGAGGSELERRGRGDEAVRKGDQRALLRVPSLERRVHDRRRSGAARASWPSPPSPGSRATASSRAPASAPRAGVPGRPPPPALARRSSSREQRRGVAGGDEQVDGDRCRDAEREDRPEPEARPDHELRDPARSPARS